MSKKLSPLKTILSLHKLEKLAGSKVFPRGEEYYEQGCVNLLFHAPFEAVAEVEGSLPYRVELKSTKDGVDADCTCPAMRDYGFCKHAVALGLFVIDAPAPSSKGKGRKTEKEKDGFSEKYPNLSDWMMDGSIEFGRDGHSTSMVRVYNEGGLVWEGGTRSRSMDKILAEAEQAIAEWLGENG